MNYHVPHSVEKQKQSQEDRECFNTRQTNENSVKTDFGITCPRISYDSDGELTLIGVTETDGQLSLNLPKRLTSLPSPLFQPTLVKCGLGMYP